MKLASQAQNPDHSDKGPLSVNSPNQSIIAEIKASGRLPSPTGVALTILEMTRDQNTSIGEMATILHGDPALSGQIIKYANSAAAGNRKPVASINDALVRLGLRMVRQLCLGFSVLSNSKDGRCEGFDFKRFWASSLAMATSCQTLARTMKTVNPDEGFTCGLLADIGGLALASVYPEKYTEVITEWANGSRAELLAVERRLLSIDRNEVTASLFEDWGLPEFYRIAVLHRDNTGWADLRRRPPSTEDHVKLANLLFAGNLAGDICMATGNTRHLLVLEFMDFARLFNLADDEFISTYDEILAEWARMGKILDVVAGQVPSMADMLRRARSAKGVKGRAGVIDDRGEPGSGVRSTAAVPAAEAEPEVAPEPQDEPEVLPGLRILVATDCPLHRKILTKKLAALGHEVDCVTDGRQALEHALTTDPQLIISDWMMPNVDGLELCRLLRSTPQMAHIHFIIMTSHDSNEELVEAFEAGINYYLVKPLNHHILAALLRGAAREVVNREEVQRQKEELRRTNAEVSITNRMLNTLALEDQLTELPNRRAGLEALERCWAKSSREKSPLLVMIMDIDHFKNVNDTFGHDAGDVVLKSTARAMKNAVREYDEICRFGGEEFMVVCPGADIEVAMLVGNRIRQAVERNLIDTVEFRGGVTISIGAAIRDESTPGTKDMIKAADEALYAAKEAGRNKVCIYTPAIADA